MSMLSCTPVYMDVCGVENLRANLAFSFLIMAAFFSRACSVGFALVRCARLTQPGAGLPVGVYRRHAGGRAAQRAQKPPASPRAGRQRTSGVLALRMLLMAIRLVQVFCRLQGAK